MKAWHSSKKVNEDHFPVFVVFNRRHPNQTSLSRERKPIAIIDPETTHEVSPSDDVSASLSPGRALTSVVEEGEVKGEKEKGDTVLCSEEEFSDADDIITI